MLKRIFAGLLVTGTLLGHAAQAEPAKLRFSSFEPPTGFVTHDILTPWAEEVTTASKGAIEIEMYAGGTLGRSPAAQLKLVEDGVADIAWIIPGYTPGRYADTDVVNVPLAVESSLGGSLALTNMMAKGLIGQEKGVKVLGIFSTGPGGLHTKMPINTLADVKGLKLRCAGAQQVAVIEALGGTAVSNITGPTAAESISRGVIDGTLAEWNAVDTFKMDRVAEYHTNIPMGAIAVLVVMNQAKYDSLSDEAKATLDQFSGKPFAQRFGSLLDAHMSTVEAKLRASPKHFFNDPKGDAAVEWQAALAPVATQWANSVPNGVALLSALKEELKTAGKTAN